MKSNADPIIENAVELTLIPGIGIRTQNKILKTVHNFADLFSLREQSLRAIGISELTIPAIRSRAYKQSAKEIVDWAIREGCHILVHGGEKYPSLLGEIENAPLVLYALGTLEPLNFPRIAIIGSRCPTLYGLQVAQSIASDLGERGVCIVSGLARGIDGAAHRGCLQGHGSTLAVLGCGIDRVYPPEHQQLKKQILVSGTILSEFPPGVAPSPQNFPIRNRIISGLSFGSLVVEANEKSGSLITARLALEQNREVFAVPGNITSPASCGPNFLIKQGAKLVQSWKDVVEEMPVSFRNEILEKEENPKNHFPELDTVSDRGKKLLSLLKIDIATHFDNIFRESNFCIPDLSEQLLNLEMDGLIRRLPGDMYILSGKFLKK